MNLAHLTIEEGDCLIWQRATTNGHPVWRIDGKSQLVRRHLWTVTHGPIPAGKIVRTTCRNTLCVVIDHLALTTYSALAKSLGPAVMGGLVRSANVARAKQGQSVAVLNWDMVREIRASTETGAAISRRMGIAQTLTSRVRSHKAWKEYSSPFAGLGSRA